MFESARLKIERADQHIADLERELRAFTKKTFDASVRPNHGRVDITITVLPPPKCIALVLGDAVHNLWSAMDHLLWELVGPDGRNNRLNFPKGKSEADYNKTCEAIETPSAAVRDLLKQLEVFPGGAGHYRYAVNRLDIVDKHRVLTPVVNVPTLDELILVSDCGEVRLLLADLYGSSPELRAGETFTVDAPEGSSLSFKNDAEISPHIVFGEEVELVQNEPIFPTIRRLRDAVAEAIDIVAARSDRLFSS